MTENTAPHTPVSPKVKAGALAGAAYAVLVAILTSITPDLLGFAGPWAPVLLVAIGAVATQLAAYQTRDPLREARHSK